MGGHRLRLACSRLQDDRALPDQLVARPRPLPEHHLRAGMTPGAHRSPPPPASALRHLCHPRLARCGPRTVLRPHPLDAARHLLRHRPTLLQPTRPLGLHLHNPHAAGFQHSSTWGCMGAHPRPPTPQGGCSVDAGWVKGGHTCLAFPTASTYSLCRRRGLLVRRRAQWTATPGMASGRPRPSRARWGLGPRTTA